MGQLAAAAVRAIARWRSPGYGDDFQEMREEVNKLSGANTELICQLAEKLLTMTAKDIRLATYHCWAKLHREGEQGMAKGLELLAGLIAVDPVRASVLCA